jgi:hypothetical protein
LPPLSLVLCMKPRVAEAVFSVNRNKLYSLMATGELPYRQIGASRYIQTADLHKLTRPKVAAE